MALSLRGAFTLKAEVRLAQAISEFEASLTPEQKPSFRNARLAAFTTPPTLKDVMQLTAEVDTQARMRHKTSRSFGPRLTNMLQSVQQYAALGDIVVGGSQSVVACGIWAAVRMVLHLSIGYLSYLEKLSMLFMEAGRQAPRYQAMALIYPKSKALQNYLFEYYIIVIRVCQRIHHFTRKSVLGQMAASLDDSDLRGFQNDLQLWATSVKEEVNVLLNQQIAEDAETNSQTRAIVNRLSDSSNHREALLKKVQWLEACSTYDYQTPWKQTRKRGSSSLLSTWSEYQAWLKDSSSSTMLLSGKIGAGKSVTLSNIVDDIHLQGDSLVVYFFCRHDLPESLKCRTILGSFTRQYLSFFSLGNDVFEKEVPLLDITALGNVLETSVCAGKRYLILDGLDECSPEERHSLLLQLSRLRSSPNWYIAFSARLSADDIFSNYIKTDWHIYMPTDNPDIRVYIESELQNRIERGELDVEDDQIVSEIFAALLEGANGMFLWVSLQLDALCLEVSTYAIRQVLQSLPKDLGETYARILKTTTKSDTRNYHMRIFKAMTAAYEPLTLDQIREMTSVTNGDISWDPSKLINNIRRILKFCGSLVMIDEEECTVRFVHHSAKSFLLGSLSTTFDHTFSETEADQELGGTILTYMSYDIFDKRMSRRLVPRFDVGSLPNYVAEKAAGGSRVAKGLLRIKSGKSRDIGPYLETCSQRHATKMRDTEHPFLLYAQRFWLLHSRHIACPELQRLWERLAADRNFFDIRELKITPHLAGPLDKFEADTNHPFLLGLTWALNYSHVFLFDYIMSLERDYGLSVRRVMARLIFFRRVLKCITCQALTPTDTITRLRMIHRLIPIAVRLRVHEAVLSMLHSLENLEDRPFRRHSDHSGRHELGSMPAPQSTQLEKEKIMNMGPSLVKVATSTQDTRILYLLVKSGMATSSQENSYALSNIMKSNAPQLVLLRTFQLLAEAGLDLQCLEPNQVYFVCHQMTTASASSKDRASLTLAAVLTEARKVRGLLTSIFNVACGRGNLKLAIASWPDRCQNENSDSWGSIFQGNEFSLAIQEISRDRFDIANRLLIDDDFPHELGVLDATTLHRVVILRNWSLARRLIDRGADKSNLIEFCARNELLHFCVLVADLAGLDFILSIGMDINHVSCGPNFSNHTPVESLASRYSDWSRTYSFRALIVRGSRLRMDGSTELYPIRFIEKDLEHYVKNDDIPASNMARLIQRELDSPAPLENRMILRELPVSNFACLLAAAMRKMIFSSFNHESALGWTNIYASVEQQTVCLTHLSKFVALLRRTFQQTSATTMRYCEIMLPVQEIIGAIELLEPQQNQLCPRTGSPDFLRYNAQAVLLQVVDLVLGKLRTQETDLRVIWDDICAILCNGRLGGLISGLIDPSGLLTEDEMIESLYCALSPVFEDGNLPWFFQCMLMLGQNFHFGTLISFTSDLDDTFFSTSSSSSGAWAPCAMDGTFKAFQLLGCSQPDIEVLVFSLSRRFAEAHSAHT